MITLVATLERVRADLDALGVRWAVIGGLAVSARAEPRLTRDVDVAVAVQDDRESEALIRALTGRGYSPFAVVEQEVTGRLATARLIPPGSSIDRAVVDLLFASSGVEPELVADAERIEILEGLVLPVARTGYLMALKLLARDDRRRPQDADDLRALARVAADADWDTASRAADYIMSRGFGRGRDLRQALVELQRTRE